MSQDRIIFIHGVNTRQQRDQPGYSKKLFDKINKKTIKRIKPVELYWGDVNEAEEYKLLIMWENSLAWQSLWFQEFRAHQLLQFIGDAALYISRAVGEKIVDKLCEQLNSGLPEHDDGCLHLVAHSWGTVILFDLLFASRWDDNANVQQIRRRIHGVPINGEADSEHNLINSGCHIASIHTMGSPLAIYQLMRTGDSSHDISARLQGFTASLNNAPWHNYLHPGDPIGYPLEKVLPTMLAPNPTNFSLSDIVLPLSGIADVLTSLVSSTPLALVNGGNAHGSYWRSDTVASSVASRL